MTLPNFLLQNKVAIVTGGSRGIGEAVAIGFAEAGANVALCSRNLADAEKVAQRITKLGRKALAMKVDVNSREDIQALVKRTVKELGAIDILANMAGIVTVGENLLEMKDEEWDLIVDTDLKATYVACQEVSRVMAPRKKGSIINTASGLAFRRLKGRTAYSVAKAGVVNLTYHLALELGDYGIRANCIAPGLIKTPATVGLMQNAEHVRRTEAETPLHRVGETSDCVGPVLFLASDAASYVTGQVIFIDGGRHIV